MRCRIWAEVCEPSVYDDFFSQTLDVHLVVNAGWQRLGTNERHAFCLVTPTVASTVSTPNNWVCTRNLEGGSRWLLNLWLLQ